MQVRKFEAKSMKEALDLVKVQMGPEAIILSAREHSRSFGIGGHQSVEVTAAVSEEVLRRKHMAERKLSEKERAKYDTSSARTQKQFIEKVFDNYREEVERKPTTTVPYIDIGDDEGHGASENEYSPAAQAIASGLPWIERSSSSNKAPAQEGDVAKGRIRSATLDAVKAVQRMVGKEERSSVAARSSGRDEKDKTIERLQAELFQLQSLVERFQKVPQTFAGAHPGADYGLPYDLSFMFEKLTAAGLTPENTAEILKRAHKSLPPEQIKKKPFVDAWVVKYFLENTQVATGRSDGRCHIFVGSSGQGKTSSLVKFASDLVINEKKSVAIVTADTFKVGASEQLRIFAQILNVPFAEVRKPGDWLDLQGRLTQDHILVDMPGVNLRDKNQLEFVGKLMPPSSMSRRVHYVQSLLAKDQDINEIASRYQLLPFDDVIFTRLDESSQHGAIYNFQKKFNVPLHSFGIGPNVPEDFEPATKERVVDLIFKLSKLRKDSNQ